MEHILFVFTSLLAMINPIAVIPVYIGLTQPLSMKTNTVKTRLFFIFYHHPFEF